MEDAQQIMRIIVETNLKITEINATITNYIKCKHNKNILRPNNSRRRNLVRRVETHRL